MELAFDKTHVSLVKVAGGAALAASLAACGGGQQPDKALSDAQRAVCVEESIGTATKILEGRRQHEGPGFIQRTFPKQGTPTEQDMYLILQQKEQAKCEDETRRGLRRHSEDRGTTYPANGTSGQADIRDATTAVPAPVEAAPAPQAPASAAPKADTVLPERALGKGEVPVAPPAAEPSASAPDKAASAPETGTESWGARMGKRVFTAPRPSASDPEAGASSPSR